MIRVLVQLWPNGNAGEASLLGQVVIANVTPHADPATYLTSVVDSSGDLVCSHVVMAHRRDDGWEALLSRALSPSTVDNSEEVEKVTSEIATHLVQATAQAAVAKGEVGSVTRGTAEAEPR